MEISKTVKKIKVRFALQSNRLIASYHPTLNVIKGAYGDVTTWRFVEGGERAHLTNLGFKVTAVIDELQA